MNILISLPIYQRDWILPYWLEAIEKQTVPLENIGFQFELGPNDEATHDILWEWQTKNADKVWCFDAIVNVSEQHSHHVEGQRAWKLEQFLKMASLRNSLLERARLKLGSFDRYFSLDSDIILENPKTLEILASHDKDVVSPFMYMTYLGEDGKPDTRFPNYMLWRGENDRSMSVRGKVGSGLVRNDVPMAAVMMKPEVVRTCSYRWHRQGEDIGFAQVLDKAGFESYLDFDLYTPHLMHRFQLLDYLKNGDPRNQSYYLTQEDDSVTSAG